MSIPSLAGPSTYYWAATVHTSDLEKPSHTDRLPSLPTGSGKTLIANSGADNLGGGLNWLVMTALAAVGYLTSPQAGKDVAAGTKELIDAIKPFWAPVVHWSTQDLQGFLHFLGSALKENGIGPAGLTGSDVQALRQLTTRAAREYDSRIMSSSARPSPNPAVHNAVGSAHPEPRSCNVSRYVAEIMPRGGGYNFNALIIAKPKSEVVGVNGSIELLTLSPSGQTFSNAGATKNSALGLPLLVTPMPRLASNGGQIEVKGQCRFTDGILDVNQSFPFNPSK